VRLISAARTTGGELPRGRLIERLAARAYQQLGRSAGL
jgi:hypothetical protein